MRLGFRAFKDRVMPMSTPSPSNPRKANGHRRRQVTARVYREEDNCGICGKPVDKTLPYINPLTGKPDPWAKSVDEIVPVSFGGSAIDRANCRLAHLDCNLRRGNGTSRASISSTLRRVRSY